MLRGQSQSGSGGKAQPGSAPGEQDALLAEAQSCFGRGELAKAETLLRQVLARAPEHPTALTTLAHIADRTGNLKAAVPLLRRAIAGDPRNVGLHNDLGIVLARLGDAKQAAGAFRRAIEINPDDPATHTNLGIWHQHNGAIDAAVKEFRRALEIDPRHLTARLNLSLTLQKAVAPWHFPMMNDAPRNALYDEAIRRVAPGRSVLDIGTGAGLLAMMAARAGARWVASCEAEPWVAAKAREVVTLNGLGDRITLIGKRSTELAIGRDLRERAEVLVTEIFGTTCINEHVIPTIEHAHAELLRPDAIVVPRAASLRGYLAGGPALEGYFFVDRAAGFELTPFNEFAQPTMGLPINNLPHEVLSDDFEIFRFDLTEPRFAAAERIIEVSARRAGRCFGVVQWLRLELGDDITYENRPRPGPTIDSWGHMLHSFSRPVALDVGERLRLLAAHNRQHFLICDLAAEAAGASAPR
jgi:Flp pilus assembly protein TadD